MELAGFDQALIAEGINFQDYVDACGSGYEISSKELRAGGILIGVMSTFPSGNIYVSDDKGTVRIK